MDAHDRRPRRQLQRGGDLVVGADAFLQQRVAAGRHAALEDVLAEGGERLALDDARLGDERALALDAVGHAVGGHAVQFAAHGHARDAEALGQDALGRQQRPRAQAGDQPHQPVA